MRKRIKFPFINRNKNQFINSDMYADMDANRLGSVSAIKMNRHIVRVCSIKEGIAHEEECIR